MKAPCTKDCPGRSPSCHAECEAYLDFRDRNAQQRERERNRRRVDGYIKDAVYAAKKSSRNWKV